jgi:hypothetical protein
MMYRNLKPSKKEVKEIKMELKALNKLIKRLEKEPSK